MKEKSKDDFWNFGDLVCFRGKLWRFVGMDEDGIIQLVRQIEEHAFGCIEFENVYYEEWDEIKTKEKTPIKNPYPDVKAYEDFNTRFCREHGITKEQLLKMLNKKKDGPNPKE